VVTNHASAFLPLKPLVQQAVNADGSLTTDFQPQAGQLVIIGRQPVLQALPATPEGARSLALYGNPGTNYQLQASTDLGNPEAWHNILSIPMTNLTQIISGLDTNPPAIFYRAY